MAFQKFILLGILIKFTPLHTYVLPGFEENPVEFMTSLGALGLLSHVFIKGFRGKLPWQESSPCNDYIPEPPRERKNPKYKWQKIFVHKALPCGRCGRAFFKHKDNKTESQIQQEWKDRKAARSQIMADKLEIASTVHKTIKQQYDRLTAPGRPQDDILPQRKEEDIGLPFNQTESWAIPIIGMSDKGSIWLSSSNACRSSFLRDMSIGSVINTAKNLPDYQKRELNRAKAMGIKILNLPLEEQQTDKFEERMVEGVKFMHLALQKGESVLVHGDTDIARPTATTLAYIMARNKARLQDASKMLQKRIPGGKHVFGMAGTGGGFANKLMEFEHSNKLMELRKKIEN